MSKKIGDALSGTFFEEDPDDLVRYFKREAGSYYFMEPADFGEDRIGYMGDAVGFVIDTSCGDGILIKHGSTEPVDLIRKWFADAQKKYRDAGLADMAERLVLVESNYWPVPLMNRFIDTSGYIGLWYRSKLREIVLEGQEPFEIVESDRKPDRVLVAQNLPGDLACLVEVHRDGRVVAGYYSPMANWPVELPKRDKAELHVTLFGAFPIRKALGVGGSVP